MSKVKRERTTKGLSAMNQETKNMDVHHHSNVEKKASKNISRSLFFHRWHLKPLNLQQFVRIIIDDIYFMNMRGNIKAIQ